MVTSLACSKHAFSNSSSVQWFMTEFTYDSSSSAWSLFSQGCFPYGSLSCLCGHLESHSDTAGWIKRALEISNFVQKNGSGWQWKKPGYTLRVITVYARDITVYARGTHGSGYNQVFPNLRVLHGLWSGFFGIQSGFARGFTGYNRGSHGFCTGSLFSPLQNWSECVFFGENTKQILFLDVFKRYSSNPKYILRWNSNTWKYSFHTTNSILGCHTRCLEFRHCCFPFCGNLQAPEAPNIGVSWI